MLDVQKKLDMSLDEISKLRRQGSGSVREEKTRGKKRKEKEETSILVARRVYVGNLSYRTTWQDLKDHFKVVGRLIHADIMRGPGERSKGCGIVEYERPEEAAAAIQDLNDTELDGRKIFVREDREDRERKEAIMKEHDPDQEERINKRIRGSKIQSDGVSTIGTRLYVSNLSWNTTWQDLKDHFQTAGKVVYADVLKDGERSKGCGIVEYETSREALRALSMMSNTELKGRPIVVREDREDRLLKAIEPASKHRTDRQLVVRGLPFSYTWQDLKDLSKGFGRVMRADIVMDKSGRSKGYGTVLFETGESAQRAILALDGSTLEGRRIGAKFDKFE